ncbi:hypothetical protein OPT61_g5936 [Boeremia exigua]|uniref:Uncharacterized protein n=1 Tax=Boeremia exigua TaxID=749465 RepID=A0ACC2I8G4_9PLEO|nr:hypothetical protein OPT61_g5936 [Boeremia exigua]
MPNMVVPDPGTRQGKGWSKGIANMSKVHYTILAGPKEIDSSAKATLLLYTFVRAVSGHQAASFLTHIRAMKVSNLALLGIRNSGKETANIPLSTGQLSVAHIIARTRFPNGQPAMTWKQRHGLQEKPPLQTAHSSSTLFVMPVPKLPEPEEGSSNKTAANLLSYSTHTLPSTCKVTTPGAAGTAQRCCSNPHRNGLMAAYGLDPASQHDFGVDPNSVLCYMGKELKSKARTFICNDPAMILDDDPAGTFVHNFRAQKLPSSLAVNTRCTMRKRKGKEENSDEVDQSAKKTPQSKKVKPGPSNSEDQPTIKQTPTQTNDSETSGWQSWSRTIDTRHGSSQPEAGTPGSTSAKDSKQRKKRKKQVPARQADSVRQFSRAARKRRTTHDGRRLNDSLGPTCGCPSFQSTNPPAGWRRASTLQQATQTLFLW